MNLKHIISLLFLLILTTGCSQNKSDEIKLFEKELNLFRYSLNKELNKLDFKKINEFNFNEKDSIVILVNNFCDIHKKDIIEYRLYLLHQYSDNKFDEDFKKYTKVSNIDFNETRKVLKNNPDAVPLSKLFYINPFDKISTYGLVYLSAAKPIIEVAEFNVKKHIAGSIITTKKVNETIWEIYENTYNQIFKSTYNPNTGDIIEFEVYERKKQ